MKLMVILQKQKQNVAGRKHIQGDDKILLFTSFMKCQSSLKAKISLFRKLVFIFSIL